MQQDYSALWLTRETLSDEGHNCKSNLLKELCQSMGVEKIMYYTLSLSK